MERYNVLKSIGSGATSEVFLVEEKRSKRTYIMKQMPSTGMSDQERARAKQEISVLQKIDHPNVVRYRESFSTHDSICIVMERCATSLDSIVDRKREEVEQGVGQPFSTSLLLEWMAELISAVHYLHTHQIIHRDIKPSNIFITDTNHLKLGDFGVCKVIRQQNEARRSLAQHPKQTTSNSTMSSFVIASHGAMLGTPLYLSPEIFEADIPEYSQASDVWALGAVFYEMCALRPPFEADNFFALIHKIGGGQPPPPFSNGVDGRFERIVSVMMRRDPKQRPTTKELIDQYVLLPDTHPSHPSQRPEYGRYIQRFHGLVVDISTSTSGGEGHSANTSALDTSRAIENSSVSPEAAPPAAPTACTSPKSSPEAATKISRRQGSGSGSSSSGGSKDSPPRVSASPQGGPVSKGLRKKGTSAQPTLASPMEKTPLQKKGPSMFTPLCGPAQCSADRKTKQHSSPASNHSGTAALIGQEDHEEALRRIRGAKSKIDVAAIRKQMLQRRLDGTTGSDSVGEIPTSVLCPVASRVGERPASDGDTPSRSPQRGLHVDPLSTPEQQEKCSSPPAVPDRIPLHETSLCRVVENYIEQHAKDVTLEDLDEVAMLLNQFKLRRFGVY